MTFPFTTLEISELFNALGRSETLMEVGILVLCLTLAWLSVKLLQGKRLSPGSIWFGERIVDGVFFPVLALAYTYAVKVILSATIKIVVLKYALPILLSLALIRMCVRVLSASFPKAGWAMTLERSISWFAWGAVVLWVTGLLPLILAAMDELRWKMGGTVISLRHLLEGLITIGLVLVIVLWVAAVIERRLLRGTGDDLSMRKMVANLIRVLLLFIGLLLALSSAGIDFTALSVVGGAIGVGLGFGLQKIAANYISGFVILAERSLRIGDMVRVDNFEGRITDIRTRFTVIRALNGREAVIPNETLITQRVENLSLADPRVLLATTVQVAYDTDVAQLHDLLIDMLKKVDRVLDEPCPTVQLSEFAADGLVLTLHFWITDPENGQGNVRSSVNMAILSLFRDNQIEIPYPRRLLEQNEQIARKLVSVVPSSSTS
jgi:small-conductance mechanosensitive channel